MKQLLLFFCAYLYWLTAAGQTFFFETKQLPIRQYDALENRLHSTRLPDEKVMVLGVSFRLGPKQRYARRSTAVRPRPVMSYTYSLPDSVVRLIEFEIDSLNYLGTSYKTTHSYREPLARYPDFLKAYAQIKQEMEAQLGKPAASKPAYKAIDALNESYRQSTNWDTPALQASLDLVFTLSTKGAPGPPNSVVLSVEGSYAYRIRATISYKNPTSSAIKSATPTAANPRQLAVAERYMTLLLAGKYPESWALLGPDIKQSMTLEQYQSSFSSFLSKLNNPEQGATLFMSGSSFAGDGKTYAVYAFKLTADKASPPGTMINIVFKDLQTELISGIQPQTRAFSGPVPATK